MAYVGGDHKDLQAPCLGQDYQPLGQGTQDPVQPGQGWGEIGWFREEGFPCHFTSHC